MIQSVFFTALTPLKNKNEINCWENRPFTTVWPENIQQRTKDISKTIKKKKKRVRTAFSTDQLRTLERTYSRLKYIDREKRADLAKSLNIEDKCIKIWFQNRRMKEKKESSESSCDSSIESESVSIETPPVSVSPPLQETPDPYPIEHLNKYSNNYADHTYQPPTYNPNQISPGYEGSQVPGFGNYFCNDTTIYPTQYYPYDVNYSNNGGNGFSQYGSEMNNYWPSNNCPYYSTI